MKQKGTFFFILQITSGYRINSKLLYGEYRFFFVRRLQNKTESDMIKSNRLKQGRYFIMNCNITVIPGDGIGPEIVREACGVLDKVGAVYGLSLIHI